jgi:anti-sigma B factor antagonist
MNINFNRNGEELQVSVEGRLDTITAPDFESALINNSNGVSSVVIDCENLVYVSSAGLRVLLSTHKRMKGAMKLINVCELVMEVFEMTGFADIWVIE